MEKARTPYRELTKMIAPARSAPLGGQAPADLTQNEGTSQDVVENKGSQEILLGISQDVIQNKMLSSSNRLSY
jgi:hypothetical protein